MKTKIARVMVADKSAVYSMDSLGETVQTAEGIELRPAMLNAWGQAAAQNINGKLVRVWHDHGAGGVFAEVEIPADEN